MRFCKSQAIIKKFCCNQSQKGNVDEKRCSTLNTYLIHSLLGDDKHCAIIKNRSNTPSIIALARIVEDSYTSFSVVYHTFPSHKIEPVSDKRRIQTSPLHPENMTLSTERSAEFHSSSHSPHLQHTTKISRSSGRRSRSYSDAHVHFSTGQWRNASETATAAFSNTNNVSDNPTNVTEKNISPLSSHHHRGNRPRSKSESEPPCHHRRLSVKKKYMCHSGRHHVNDGGRHSPPSLSSSPCCGKMWVRPMSCQRNISGSMQTRAQDDWHISALSSDRGPPSPPQASNLPQGGTSYNAATKYLNEGGAASFSANRSSSSPIKSKMTYTSDSGCTGRQDELMMMYPYPSLPTPLTPPSTTIAFGESGKPIIRVKNIHQQEEDVFESDPFLPVLTSSSSSSTTTKSVRRSSGVMM